MLVMQVSTQWMNSAVQAVKNIFSERKEPLSEKEHIARLSVDLPANERTIKLFESKIEECRQKTLNKALPEDERFLIGLRSEAWSEALTTVQKRQARDGHRPK